MHPDGGNWRCRILGPCGPAPPASAQAHPQRSGGVGRAVDAAVPAGGVGGLGAHVLTFASDSGLIDAGLKLRTMRLPDVFQDQDKPEAMYAQAGLDAEGIARGAMAALGVSNAGAAGRRA